MHIVYKLVASFLVALATVSTTSQIANGQSHAESQAKLRKAAIRLAPENSDACFWGQPSTMLSAPRYADFPKAALANLIPNSGFDPLNVKFVVGVAKMELSPIGTPQDDGFGIVVRTEEAIDVQRAKSGVFTYGVLPTQQKSGKAITFERTDMTMTLPNSRTAYIGSAEIVNTLRNPKGEHNNEIHQLMSSNSLADFQVVLNKTFTMGLLAGPLRFLSSQPDVAKLILESDGILLSLHTSEKIGFRLVIRSENQEQVGKASESLNTLIGASKGFAGPMIRQSFPEDVHAPMLSVVETITKDLVFKSEKEGMVAERTVGADEEPAFVSNLSLVVKHLEKRRIQELARSRMMNQIKQVLLACLNKESKTRKLPSQAIYAADGTPLLSWRVEVLQFMGEKEKALYDRFRVSESWDSPHNKKLLSAKPNFYGDDKNGNTQLQAIVGDDCVFSGLRPQGYLIGSVRDGTSKTAYITFAKQAVPWTKPDDFDRDKGEKLLVHPQGDVPFGFVDGHVRFVPLETVESSLKAMSSIAGGETWN